MGADQKTPLLLRLHMCKETEREVQVSLLAIIDYCLIFIFFICIAGLLLLSLRSCQQQVAVSVSPPSLRESLGAYLFLAVLFLLFVILTVHAQRRREQYVAFG